MSENAGINEIPEKITLGVVPYLETYVVQHDQVLIHFVKEMVEDFDIQQFLVENDLEIISTNRNSSFSRYSDDLSIPIWVKLKKQYRFQEFFKEFLTKNSSLVRLISPVYYSEGQGKYTASSPVDFLLVKFEEGLDDEEVKIEHLVQAYALEYYKNVSENIRPLHYFRVTKPIDFETGELNYFGARKKISEEPGISSVGFEWIAIGGYLLPLADDPYLNLQWNLNQIQAPIESTTGWPRTALADGGVAVAIIDSGFELSHEDLQFTLNVRANYTHFNAEEFQLGMSEPYNAGPSIFPHGTLVAGAAAAIINNNRGIGSVAGTCEIMPIRIGVIITDVRVALGLNWARSHGAKVANMSFRCDPTEVVINAIEDAWTSGMVICAGVGNNADNASSPPIYFPARHDKVIAVGASDPEDQRKRKRSTSRESEQWASHYGQELGVIAPGVLIWTTDELGVNGWNENNGGRYIDPPWGIDYPSCGDLAGNYFSVFSGTSASSPQVAGLAALLFSKDTTLTNTQVRDIIEQTCDKVNPGIYSYTSDGSHPNGPWNEEMGYGRINCSAALLKATSTLSIPPPIPLPLSQNQITPLASIGDTTSRIVLVYVKNPTINPNTNQPVLDGTEGIYKVDLDKNTPIPDLERFPILSNASKVVASAFYNDQFISVLAIITDKTTEQIGVSYVTPDPANNTGDIFFAGKIIGDLYQHCPLTPKPIGGKITNIGGKFYSDGDHFVTFYNFKDATGVDNLGWLGRH